MNPEILTTISNFLAADYPEKAHVLTDGADLFALEILDSFRILNLVLFVEETYSVTLELDDLTEENFQTLTLISKLVETKMSTT